VRKFPSGVGNRFHCALHNTCVLLPEERLIHGDKIQIREQACGSPYGTSVSVVLDEQANIASGKFQQRADWRSGDALRLDAGARDIGYPL
jgi:hypothetical protein